MLRSARATRKAGAPSVGLLNVPYSTFAGASVARGATHSGRSFRRFATTWCEKSGLDGDEEQETCQDCPRHSPSVTEDCNRSFQIPESQVHQHESKAMGPVKKRQRDQEKEVNL